MEFETLQIEPSYFRMEEGIHIEVGEIGYKLPITYLFGSFKLSVTVNGWVGLKL